MASTVAAVDPASSMRLPAIRGLERIAATVGAVDHVTFCNLANSPKRQPQAPWRLFHRGCDVQHSQGQVHVLNWHLRYGHAAQVSDRWDRPPNQQRKAGEIIMKTVWSVLIALSIIAGVAGTASAEFDTKTFWEDLSRSAR